MHTYTATIHRVQRVRFINMILHGSSQMTVGTQPLAPTMLVEGHVADLEMIAIALNGSTASDDRTATDYTLYGCIEFRELGGLIPTDVTIIGDLRTCDGVGLDVKQCNNLNVVLTVEQASMGRNVGDAVEDDLTAANSPAIRFGTASVAATAGARIRAISTYGGDTDPDRLRPPGAKLTVPIDIRPYVLVERSSGDVAGMHMQRIVTSAMAIEDRTFKFYDETLIANSVGFDLFLPPLDDVPPRTEYYVMDGTGTSGTITVKPSGTETIEGLSSVTVSAPYGKRGFRRIQVDADEKWITWVL